MHEFAVTPHLRKQSSLEHSSPVEICEKSLQAC